MTEVSDTDFQTVSLSDWADVREVFDKLTPDWVFRGQRDSSWELETSLERYVGSHSQREAERRVLDAFQRRAHHYLGSTLRRPRDGHYIEWMSLIQHHGGPTRLLDWTRSPYVALFFAMEDAVDPDGHCAVWALDEEWLHFKSVDAIADQNGGSDFVTERHRYIAESEFRHLVMDAAPTAVLPVEPWEQHARVSIQQSIFLCQGNLERPFLDNLLHMAPKASNHVIKFLIPVVALRPVALKRLRLQMNISRASLFPGLDGFTQSLRQLIAENDFSGGW